VQAFKSIAGQFGPWTLPLRRAHQYNLPTALIRGPSHSKTSARTFHFIRETIAGYDLVTPSPFAAVLCGGVPDAAGGGLVTADDDFETTAVGAATVLNADREGCTAMDEENDGV
jgi:hypothetical protein